MNVVHFIEIDHIVFNTFLSCAACLYVNLIKLVMTTDNVSSTCYKTFYTTALLNSQF